MVVSERSLTPVYRSPWLGFLSLQEVCGSHEFYGVWHLLTGGCTFESAGTKIGTALSVPRTSLGELDSFISQSGAPFNLELRRRGKRVRLSLRWRGTPTPLQMEVHDRSLSTRRGDVAFVALDRPVHSIREVRYGAESKNWGSAPPVCRDTSHINGFISARRSTPGGVQGGDFSHPTCLVVHSRGRDPFSVASPIR